MLIACNTIYSQLLFYSLTLTIIFVFLIIRISDFNKHWKFNEKWIKIS